MQFGDLAPGSRFGRYTIEKVIGRGGMGVVYSAREDGLNRIVALKVIAPELVRDPAFRVRFLREGRVAAGLEHPNIVPVFAADEVDGQPYIAMRYVPGTDLKSLLSTVGRLDPPRALSIFTPLADALDVANDQGLVHRDVKPANILVGPDGYDGQPRVYLTDLGLTRDSTGSALTQQGMLVGTVEYMAPEQVEGRSLAGAADQYALAASLYEALTGRLPFEASSLTALLVAKLRDLPPLPSSLRPELGADFDRVMERAMALAPEVRFPSCVAFVRAARSALPEFVAPPVRGRTVIEPLPAPPAPVERHADTQEREIPHVAPDADTREREVHPGAPDADTREREVPPVVPVEAGEPVDEPPAPHVDPGATTRERPAPPLPGEVEPESDAAEEPALVDLAEDPVADDHAPAPAPEELPATRASGAVDLDEPVANAPIAEELVSPGTVVDRSVDEPEDAAATAGRTRAPRPEPARTAVRPSDPRRPAPPEAPGDGRGQEREPDRRARPSRRGVVIAGVLTAVALAGVGSAIALGGGDGESPGTTTAAGSSSVPAGTAGGSVAVKTGTTTPATTAGSAATAPHATDTPKEGWTPASPTALFTFAAKPQDGVVDYSVPTSKLRYRVVVRGPDLVVDVRFQQGDYAREWVRFRGQKFIRACLQPRGAGLQCGSTAAQLRLSASNYQDLLAVRRGYFDALVTLKDLKTLKDTGTLTNVALDQKIGFPIVCAEPPAKETSRICVQENGFVTQWRSGTTRITATAVRIGARAADLRPPA